MDFDPNTLSSSPHIPSAPPPGNGLGSLADELAGAWSGDEYEGEEEDYFDDAAAAAFSSAGTTSTAATPSPPTPVKRPGSSGSEDESEVVDKSGGISHELEEQLKLIERLASGKGLLLEEVDGLGINLGTYGISGLGGDEYDEYGGVAEEGGGREVVDEKVVERFMEGLQTLPAQSAIETGTSRCVSFTISPLTSELRCRKSRLTKEWCRLITAHAAIASWLTSQTTILRDLSFNLLEIPVEDTFPLLAGLVDLIPEPTPAPHAELTQIHLLTTDLISQLSFISDTLHMSRQSSILANRKLRVAREACAEWKAELKMVERCRRSIEDGGWDEKIRSREASRTCGDVVGGFEEVCKGFEAKMREWEGVC
jgi:hypothetical protein